MNIKLKLRLLVALAIGSVFCTLHAQVTIGTMTEPVNGVLLELKEFDDNEAQIGGRTANRGLMMPRVALSDATNLFPMFDAVVNNKYVKDGIEVGDKSSIDEDHVGLSVWGILRGQKCSNLAGMYVWNGSAWQITGQGVNVLVDGMEETGTSKNVSWELKDHILRVKGTGALPANLNLGTCLKYIEHIVVEEGITSFERGTHFSSYPELISIVLPESLSSGIGLSSISFNGNPKLESIKFPSFMDTLKYSNVFKNNPMLTTITFPKKVDVLHLSQSLDKYVERLEFPEQADSIYISQTLTSESNLATIVSPKNARVLYISQSFIALSNIESINLSSSRMHISQSFGRMSNIGALNLSASSLKIVQSFDSLVNNMTFSGDLADFTQSFMGETVSKINKIEFLNFSTISLSSSFTRVEQVGTLAFPTNVTELSATSSFRELLTADSYRFPSVGRLSLLSSFGKSQFPIPPNRN